MKKGWGKSILSDASTQINEAVRKFTADKERMIEKSLKKYCQKYGIDYQGFLDSGLLTSEDHPNKEVFLFDGKCIFYIQKTKGQFGTVMKLKFVEKF